MLIYVFNLRKKLWILLVPVVIIIFVILLQTMSRNSIGVFTANKELPIYSVDTSEKKVSITFDCAWGADDIPEILKILQKENVKASFFIVGQWAEKFPEAVKRISLAGHDVANHSYSHLRMGTIDNNRLAAEISEANKKLEEISGSKVTLFRAPYGDYNNQVILTAKKFGLSTIQWSVDSLDWKPGISEQEITDRILNMVFPGSIILFHNDTTHTVKLLPSIINALRAKGYDFLPVSQMILTDNYIIDSEGKQRKD